jgi:hypothetical protein
MEEDMRRMGWAGVAIAAAAVGLVGVGVQGFGSDGDDGGRADARVNARECSEATLKGAYGILMQGTRPSGPGGPIETLSGVVHRVYDGEGQFTQVDNVKGSITGIVPDREGSGTYEVNADCTGVTHFEPGPGISIEERLVIVDGGQKVFSVVSSPPPLMVTTVQERIAKR